jgi:hypothetical protein
MSDGTDWVMRPVLARMCNYESLLDGTIGLADVARMNEALDVQEYNQFQIAKALKDGR